MIRILTVCTANICRSPAAELILRDRLRGSATSVSSAGTRARPGQPMARLSAELAKVYGVRDETLAAHGSRPISEAYVASSHLILAMDRTHRRHVVELVPSSVRRTFTLREFGRLASSLTDDELLNGCRPEGQSTIGESHRRLGSMLDLISSRRAAVFWPAAAEDDDIEDPYGRSEATYRRSIERTVPSLAQVERVVRLALPRL